MSSTRLPGKVLRPIAGKPTLTYLIERLERVPSADAVIIATSTDPSDDAIEEHCRRLGARCHRGPLENVAARFAEVAERFELDAFARITGDSPVIDWRVVDRAISIFRAGDPDLVTNVFPSTFPSGQSVEVARAAVFLEAFEKMEDPYEQEHVTPYFYRHPDEFKIVNFTAAEDEGSLDMSLDTLDDAKMLETVISHMDKPHWEYTSDELVRLYRAVEG